MIPFELLSETKNIEIIAVGSKIREIERWKVYRVVADEKAEKRGLLRITDESGEDYLYSAQDFAAIELPEKVETEYLALI